MCTLTDHLSPAIIWFPLTISLFPALTVARHPIGEAAGWLLLLSQRAASLHFPAHPTPAPTTSLASCFASSHTRYDPGGRAQGGQAPQQQSCAVRKGPKKRDPPSPSPLRRRRTNGVTYTRVWCVPLPRCRSALAPSTSPPPCVLQPRSASTVALSRRSRLTCDTLTRSPSPCLCLPLVSPVSRMW